MGDQFYATRLGTYDEMHATQGQLLPHWEHLMQALEAMGSTGLERRRQEAQRLLRENGVTYNVYGAPQVTARPWQLDPVPLLISGDEWSRIEAGLQQRAQLLDLILADLYGPQALIKNGLLPLEAVYAHAGFLRSCVGLTPPGGRSLILHGVNLARGPDGRMWVLDDRTQAPSGTGYALENRTVMTRIVPSLFRDIHVHRLAGFFRGLRQALARIAPHNRDDPRVVVLTPGPLNETYFEHAYLASYLGYTLVQGDDLTVRDGKVWLKTLEGLQLVDVILRRLDDSFCDPLELRGDSLIGTPGLLDAARRGNVALANPIGSSLLENPALFPFLPGIARFFLGQELLLPSVATWWCGQPRERQFVLENLERLVIKPINRLPGSYTLFGSELGPADLEQLRARILAKPHLYVGQERVSFSTAPSLIDGQIEPRHAVLRTFLVARDHDYLAMPGGLTRIAPEKGALLVSGQAGGVSKDTWVLAAEPDQTPSLWLHPQRDQALQPLGGALPSRAADNLFWVGRYAERAESSARLLRSVLQKLREVMEFGDPHDQAALHCLLRALTHVTSAYPGFVGEGSEQRLANSRDELVALIRDAACPGSLAATLQAFGRATFAVRDLWSADAWRVVDDIQRRGKGELSVDELGNGHLQGELDQLIVRLVAFSGLSSESMPRDSGWLLLEVGRRMERALALIALLRATLVARHADPVESLVLEAVLTTCESLTTFRRRYRSYLQLPAVLDLLLLEENHPRSLGYQLRQLKALIVQLPREHRTQRLEEDERAILEADSALRLADPLGLTQVSADQGIYVQLDELLSGLSGRLWALSEALTRSYFSHSQGPHLLSALQLEDGI